MKEDGGGRRGDARNSQSSSGKRVKVGGRGQEAGSERAQSAAF